MLISFQILLRFGQGACNLSDDEKTQTPTDSRDQCREKQLLLSQNIIIHRPGFHDADHAGRGRFSHL